MIYADTLEEGRGGQGAAEEDDKERSSTTQASEKRRKRGEPFFSSSRRRRERGRSRGGHARFRSRRDGKINSVICVYIPPQYTSRFCLSSSPWRPSFPELWLPCKREPGIRVMHAGYLQWKKKKGKKREIKRDPAGANSVPHF